MRKFFKFHYFGGGSVIFEGSDVADACKRAGYSSGAAHICFARHEELTREGLLALGTDATIADVVTVFGRGNPGGLSSFARKELPRMAEALGAKTIGELAEYRASEITGPRCCFAGNKTVSWLEMVFEEFGLELLRGEPPVRPDNASPLG